jgi:N-acetyl-1-D-myo-inositol-2-amino-2-deoxy-alpha-D-glucopyranoside deacetylase
MAVQQRTLLFVHAHPDDESVSTGGTIAHHVAQGDRVCVVTCTQGEQGKIALPELAQASADRDDTLGQIRAGELAQALRALGVDDHRWLVHQGCYRDSGRMGLASNDRPEAFWQADVDQAGAWLAQVIRQLRADAVVTYDPVGGYHHPDHIQAHRVAMRAVEMAQMCTPQLTGAPWPVPHVLWCAVPRRLIQAELDELARHQGDHPYLWVDTDLGQYPDGVHDEAEIAVQLDVSAQLGAKRVALGCHRTQLSVHGDYWVLASGRGMRIQDREWYIDARAWLAGARGIGWRDSVFPQERR